MIFFVLNISVSLYGLAPVAHLEVQFFFPMDVALFASDVDQLSQLLGELGEAQLGREVGCLSKGKGSEKKREK